MRCLKPAIYTKNYYLSCCRGFKEFFQGKMSPRLWQAFYLAELKPKQKVLDIGTGRGELALESAKFGCQSWGIDYSESSISIAKKNLKKSQKKKWSKSATFKKMNAKKLEFPSSFFDRIFLIDVIEHLYPEEIKKVLKEANRVIKPKGKIIIHTPNRWLIKSIYFITGLFFGWKKSKYHVNEQSFFSLKRNLRQFPGKNKVFFKQRKKYFSNAVADTELPKKIKKTCRILDSILENKLVSFIIYNTALVYILGTDLWAVIDL
jgi:ubiquinone/menaquinone biosynthesis C-methylase UbiE